MGYLKQYLCNSTCKQKTLSSMLSKILSLQWQVARVYIVAFNMKILLRILMPSAIFTYFKSLYKLRYTLHNIIVEHIHAKKLVSTTKCPVSWCDTNNEVADHERNLTKRLLLIGYSDTITHVTLNTKYVWIKHQYIKGRVCSTGNHSCDWERKNLWNWQSECGLWGGISPASIMNSKHDSYVSGTSQICRHVPKHTFTNRNLYYICLLTKWESGWLLGKICYRHWDSGRIYRRVSRDSTYLG